MYQFNDGGRSAAGFKGAAGDCGARSMAIALDLDYKTVYKELAQANKDMGYAKSARNGMTKDIFEWVLGKHGWTWRQSPKFEGRKARCSDLKGTVIARQAHHYVAVIDGVVNDIWDCTHKMAYGYWAKS